MMSNIYGGLMTNIIPGNTQTTLHPAVQAFAEGVEGVTPTPLVVKVADTIARAAIEKTVEPEISVDIDGALSFDLRLANGLLLMAELEVQGGLDASIYDDKQGVLIKRLRNTTDTELILHF